VTYKDDAGTEELAGLRPPGSNISGVENRRALIGVLEPGPVWKKPIPVNDVKEVSHADLVRPDRKQLPVTDV
jgi:hypothetical protein